ncbi:MAG: TonB-dependent receptor [Holophaga sp.]|nr:TonB-dependent receptor [Holophaga sp.]
MANAVYTSLAFLLVSCMATGAEAPPTSSVAPNGKKEEKDKAKKGTFKLGEVTVAVTGKLEVLEQVHTRVDASTIQAFNTDTVSAALTLLPGLTTSLNPKAETVIYLRGHDSRRVPVYLDGIPCYVPYEGQMDFGRFSTFDLAEIQVAKGFSSVLFGPNTLGGAINLVTRRPVTKFEGDVLGGIFDGNGKKIAANLGANLGTFYLQAGASVRDVGDFRMSSNFQPNAREDGGRRENSYSKDSKYSFKFGLTPNPTDEYVIGLVIQNGEKGQPTATDPAIQARYWRWPQWDKQSAYFTTNTALGTQSYVRLRAYFDTYKNTLNAYTNGSYTTLQTTGGMAPTGISIYDDFTRGAILEVGTTALRGNSLRAVIQTKTDVHREDNATNAWKGYRDDLRSVGLEDAITLNESVDLSLGLGLDQQRPVDTGAYLRTEPRTCFQGQLGAFWKIAPAVQVYATIAKKGRFPTLKDRYSLRFATFIENPELKPERSLNLDLGVKSSPTSWLSLEGALFQSEITDLIQEVKFVSGQKSQMQNIGKVRHRGVELSFGLKPANWTEVGANYTYLDRENLSNPETKLTSTPRNRLTGFMRVMPSPQWLIQASVENQDKMWDNNTLRLGGYTTTTFSVAWKPIPPLTVDAGFSNLLDRNYQQVSGYPMPGRTWFTNTRYRF